MTNFEAIGTGVSLFWIISGAVMIGTVDCFSRLAVGIVVASVGIIGLATVLQSVFP